MEKVIAGRSLSGKRIVVTRAQGPAAEEFAAALNRCGAEVIYLPAIRIEPPQCFDRIDSAIGELQQYRWIVFSSGNGVRSFHSRMLKLSASATLPRSCKVAAVGPKTAAVLRELFREADVIPSTFTASAIADVLGDVAGMRILLPRGDLAGTDVLDRLEQQGATAEDVCCYRTIAGCGSAAENEVRSWIDSTLPDLLSFTSPSTVTGVFNLLQRVNRVELFQQIPIACIGPITAERVVELGGKPAAVAQSHTTEGLLAAIQNDVW